MFTGTIVLLLPMLPLLLNVLGLTFQVPYAQLALQSVKSEGGIIQHAYVRDSLT